MNSFRLLLLLLLLSYGSALGITLILMWIYKGSVVAKSAIDIADLLIYNENSNITDFERGMKIAQAVAGLGVAYTLITLV